MTPPSSRFAALISAALLALAPAGCGRSSKDQQLDELTTLTVKKLSNEAFGMWAQNHLSASCPTTIDELFEYMGEVSRKDPWGHPYRMRCGAELPAGAKSIAISSDGPDGKPDTADDLKSW